MLEFRLTDHGRIALGQSPHMMLPLFASHARFHRAAGKGGKPPVDPQAREDSKAMTRGSFAVAAQIAAKCR